VKRPGHGWVFALAAGLLLGADCSSTEEVRERFNQDDSFEVSVGEETLPASQATLSSTTGSVEVGVVTLEPGGGPPGTLHTLEVWVDAEYAGEVDAAIVVIDSGERGERNLELVADSADERLYWIELQSVGDDDETRTDVFNIQLWSTEEPVVEDETDEG
jgi:hypothetical protein